MRSKRLPPSLLLGQILVNGIPASIQTTLQDGTHIYILDSLLFDNQAKVRATFDIVNKVPELLEIPLGPPLEIPALARPLPGNLQVRTPPPPPSLHPPAPPRAVFPPATPSAIAKPPAPPKPEGQENTELTPTGPEVNQVRSLGVDRVPSVASFRIFRGTIVLPKVQGQVR